MAKLIVSRDLQNQYNFSVSDIIPNGTIEYIIAWIKDNVPELNFLLTNQQSLSNRTIRVFVNEDELESTSLFELNENDTLSIIGALSGG